MTELKKELKVLSEWVKFELETDLIDPPEIEFRIEYMNMVDLLDCVDVDGRVFSMKKLIKVEVPKYVKEWSVKKEKKNIPLTDEMKQKHLIPLLGAKLKDQPIFLGLAIYNYASDRKNFLKN